MFSETAMWIIFFTVVFIMLVLDLAVINRKAHRIGMKEALVWSGIWIGLALAFNLGLYFFYDSELAVQFLTGYLIEKSLSIDNLFVFIMVFMFFGIEQKYQHKILFWGIISALVLRAVFIFAGVALIETFSWIIWVFGGFLIFTGIKMLLSKENAIHPEKNPVFRLIKTVFPLSDETESGKFFIKGSKGFMLTPLFLCLVIIELTDIIFAVDSVPAILAVSSNTFIIYSSNVFAILGLRSLYFALAGINELFSYLKYGIVCILIFVGFKMLLPEITELVFHKAIKIPTLISLLAIAFILGTTIIASVIRKNLKERDSSSSGRI
jgi:tellurite resistance protein TerC